MSNKKQRVLEPLITKILHRPTYYVATMVRPDGIPLSRPHSTPIFRKKRDVQSTKSQSRLKNTINWMLLFSEKKTIYSKQAFLNKRGELQHYFTMRLAFITLTLSDAQKHSDAYIKEHMLQPFLYWLTRYYNCTYVWKAEIQNNGNIHFHITVDTFIHWKSVRAKWNSILCKHGYLKINQSGSMDKSDSATQIKSVINENQVAKYFTGYMSKKNEFNPPDHKRKLKKLQLFSIPDGEFTFIKPAERKHYLRCITGRLWGCSESVSNITCFTDELDTHMQKTMTEFDKRNKPINLGEKLIAEKMLEALKIPVQDLELRQMDELSIRKKYDHLRNVYVHRNLKYCHLPAALAHKLATIKSERRFPTQKHFTIESIT